jgi:hypothetical protein
MTDLLRRVGNLGAHAGDAEVDFWDAELLDDFFRSVINTFISRHPRSGVLNNASTLHNQYHSCCWARSLVSGKPRPNLALLVRSSD